MLQIGRWFLRNHDWPASRRVRVPDVEIEWLQTLADHPGFIHLCAKLEDQKASLELMRRALVRNIELDIPAESLVRQLIRMDEAIKWMGYLQDHIRRSGAEPNLALFEPAAKERPPQV